MLLEAPAAVHDACAPQASREVTCAEEAHDHHSIDLPVMPLGMRIVNLLVILLPLVALVIGIVLAWGWGISWVGLGLMVGMYILTGLGITVGYHRLFTHKSFDTGPVMTAVLGVLGSMAVEGSILRWSAVHRRHHNHSDEEGDPHSPHAHGEGLRNMLRGFWDAHAGWLFRHTPEEAERYVPDLRKSRLVRTISRLFPLWVLLSLVIPTVIGGLITWSWWGALVGFLWGGLVRIALVHHITWSINSVCHIWGTRAFNSHDHSRNNAIFGILGFGEGWHNNHHAFPASARHGLRWWELDTSYLVIWAMKKVGLAWNVRVPAPERVEAKRRR